MCFIPLQPVQRESNPLVSQLQQPKKQSSGSAAQPEETSACHHPVPAPNGSLPDSTARPSSRDSSLGYARKKADRTRQLRARNTSPQRSIQRALLAYQDELRSASLRHRATLVAPPSYRFFYPSTLPLFLHFFSCSPLNDLSFLRSHFSYRPRRSCLCFCQLDCFHLLYRKPDAHHGFRTEDQG